MEKIEETVHVPAKTYVRTKYIASDGEEFWSEHDCLQYERILKNAETKPCPWCGSKAKIIDWRRKSTSYYAYEQPFCVTCSNAECVVRPCTTHYVTEVEAIEAWNTRV